MIRPALIIGVIASCAVASAALAAPKKSAPEDAPSSTTASTTFESTIDIERKPKAIVECSERVANQEGSAEALAACEAAVAEAPDSGDPYYYRAYARYFLGDFAGAEDDCTLAIEKGARRLAESYYLRGAAKEKQKRLREAAGDFRKALELKPGWSQAQRKVDDYHWVDE